MNFHPARSALSLAVVAAALTPAAAHAADTTLQPALAAPTQVAGVDNVAMWSVKDAATGKFKLVKSVDGGAAVDVPVPERDGAFDIDLGTHRSGSPFAVYTRGGDVYRLQVSTSAETKLTSISSPRLAERMPTIERGEIAFIRRDGSRDQLRIGNTTSGSKGTRLLVSAPRLLSAELGIKQVAYVTSTRTVENVHIRNISSGRDSMVYRAASGGANTSSVTKPSYAGNAFYWARANQGSGTGNRVVRYSLRDSKLAYAQGNERYATSAYLNPKLGLIASSALIPSENDGCEDGGVNYCNVTLTGPLSFTLGTGL